MRRILPIISLIFLYAVSALGQIHGPSVPNPADSGLPPLFLSLTDDAAVSPGVPQDQAKVPVVIPVSMPRMAPDLALRVYRDRAALQNTRLVSYSATTVIRAQLPDTQQSGEYELERDYSAPHTLAFKAVRYTGDNFVKGNVILRLLQSEVEHVQKDDPSLNAISPENYKFSYKGLSQVNDRTVYVYQLKPRHKRVGLFKGRIYLDAYNGGIVRAEGTVSKSPSLFIKRILFVQDYQEIGPFTLPVRMHSEAQTRLVGRAIVDVYENNYQPIANSNQSDDLSRRVAATPSL